MANNSEFSGNVVGDNATIVQGGFHATFNTVPSETNHAFLNKNSKTDPFYDKKRILELKGPLLHESFNWILDHEGFKKWRHTKESSVLWIKGDPGKGKTMLLCGIIEDLERIPGENSNLGYFFCQATDSRINSASSVVAGLIFSLVKQNPTLFSPICKQYEDKLSQLDGPNAWAVLGDIFEAVTQIGGIPAPVCVVDALDECEHDCKLLLSLILKTSNHVKWLLSSRNVKDIERGLRLIEPTRRLCLELKENAENVSKCVDVYINNSISGIEALEENEELQIKTVTTLKRKANGTFLWVALVIEQLRDTDRRNVEEVLEEIPEGLENLYDQIVRRANAKLRQKDREACQILLSIVTTAERPLHLEELHTFISSQWAHYKSSYDLLDIKDIVKDCGPLFAIRDDIIYFIHQSVKDYMVGNAYNSIFPSGIQYQHRKMFETSMSAISRILKHDIYNLKDPQSHINDIRSPHPDPLLPIKYSCVFWVDHLIRGYDSERFKSEECFKGDGLLQTFLKIKYLCWLEALALLHSLTPQGGSALQRLDKLAASCCKRRANGHQATNSQEEVETNYFVKLIGDAYRFFHYCQDFVGIWPLQLYYSAIAFEDKYSEIYKAYRQSIRAHFGHPYTVIKMPQRRRFSQRNIDISKSVAKLLYSPDSSALCVSFRFSDKISLYRTNVVEPAIQLSAKNAKNRAYFVSFLPDSKYLVSVSSGGIVQTWAIDSGIQVQQLSLNLDMSKRHADYPSEVFQEEVISLSPHGDLAASAFSTSYESLAKQTTPAFDKYLSSMKIWATKTGACANEIVLMRRPSFRNSYFFAPNSALIALIHDNEAIIYSVQTGKSVKQIRVPDSAYLKQSKFSQDSALLALAYSLDGIQFWCTKTWKQTCEIKMSSIQDFDLSLNGSMFVAASKKTWVFGSTRTGKQPLTIATGDMTTNVSFSPDWSTSSLLASANSDTVQIWRIDTRDSSAKMRSAYSASSVPVISPGSKYVAATSLEGDINIWNGKSGKCIKVLKGSSDPGVLTFSPNLEFVACAEGDWGDVRIWRMATWKSLHLLEGDFRRRHVHEIIFSDDSKYLVAGYSNKDVRVWCVDSGKCLFRSDEKNGDNLHFLQIWALAISPKSKYMARASGQWGSESWEVHIWDWRAWHKVSSFNSEQPQRENDSRIESLSFSSDATILAIICNAGEIEDTISTYEAQILEVATGTCITCVAIGESYSRPLFDPITNKILTDRAGFCKGSSWEHWEKNSRRAYSLRQPPRQLWRQSNPDSFWICFGGEKISFIPREVSPGDLSVDNVAMSSTLLAYRTHANEMMIIQIPSKHEIQRLGIITLDKSKRLCRIF